MVYGEALAGDSAKTFHGVISKGADPNQKETLAMLALGKALDATSIDASTAQMSQYGGRTSRVGLKFARGDTKFYIESYRDKYYVFYDTTITRDSPFRTFGSDSEAINFVLGV